ncbi:MAG: RecQ family ATP-dependent DNA helicase [Treponema sp.]
MKKNDELLKCAHAVLKTTFGYNEFRPMQQEVIASVLAGHDTLAVMPTGGGKSLCYQIPALLFEGITLVVSPLISLMQDQVASLVENGISAVFLNSSLEWSEYLNAVKRIKSGSIKLVYLSPEALAAERTQSILHDASVPVSCITVDEAHCISEWGHDFRPDYLEISNIRSQFAGAVCLALTATATAQVRSDIAANLCLQTPEVFIAGFNRANIFLEVRPKRDALHEVISCIEKYSSESGIIYCFSRKQVDKLTEQLRDSGYSALNYHAGLSDEERQDHQQQFIRDKVRIMVATVAFGMGIDKPNVRFVIHYDLPKSLEEYYQEIGRAGRDGLASHALLLYSAGDARKIRSFFEDAADGANAERLLQGMLGFASARTCRRHFLLSYFGERFVPTVDAESFGSKNTHSAPDRSEVCYAAGSTGRHTVSFPCCDVCSSPPPPLKDVTIPAQKFMSCIYRTQSRFGLSYIVDVLLGSKQKRILENRHDKLSTWGIGRELIKEDWFTLSDALIHAGLIKKTGDYNVLSITGNGKRILASRAKIELPIKLIGQRTVNQVVPTKNGIIHKKDEFLRNLSEADSALYATIKEWRKHAAEEENVPPYVIFGDKTIEDLVFKKPRTVRELRNIFGIGEIKAEKFGTALLRLVENTDS